MARRKAGEPQVEVQEDLFPELDVSKAAEKACLLAARKVHKIRTERSQTLKDSKEQEQTLTDSLIDKMRDAGIKAFRYDGWEVEVIPGKSKAIVKKSGEVVADETPEE